MSNKTRLNTLEIAQNIYDVLKTHFTTQINDYEEKILSHLKQYYPSLNSFFPNHYLSDFLEDVTKKEMRKKYTKDLNETTKHIENMIAEMQFKDLPLDGFLDFYTQKYGDDSLIIDYLKDLHKSEIEVRFFYQLEEDPDDIFHAEKLDGSVDTCVHVQYEHNVDLFGDDEYVTRIITIGNQSYVSGHVLYHNDESYAVLTEKRTQPEEAYIIAVLLYYVQCYALKNGEGSIDDDFNERGSFNLEIYYSFDNRKKFLKYFKEHFILHQNTESNQKNNYSANVFMNNAFTELNFCFSLSKLTIHANRKDILITLTGEHKAFLTRYAKRAHISGQTMREHMRKFMKTDSHKPGETDLETLLNFDAAA